MYLALACLPEVLLDTSHFLPKKQVPLLPVALSARFSAMCMDASAAFVSIRVFIPSFIFAQHTLPAYPRSGPSLPGSDSGAQASQALCEMWAHAFIELLLDPQQASISDKQHILGVASLRGSLGGECQDRAVWAAASPVSGATSGPGGINPSPAPC